MRFVNVDRFLSVEPGRSASAIRNVTLTEDVFATHFPNFPILPGVLVTETMSQVAAWASASAYQLERRARLVALRGAKFRQFVRPGDQLLIEVEHLRSTGDRELWKARAKVGTKLIAAIAELEYVIEAVPLTELAQERERFAWAGGDRVLAQDLSVI